MEYSLTHIFGIGLSRSRKILTAVGVSPDVKSKEVSESDLKKISDFIAANYRVEGDLKSEITIAIRRLIDIKSYRGMRHVSSLPVRGQRTKTNARTRKGRVRRAVANKDVIRK